MKIIANIRTGFREKFGIPRQAGIASEAVGRIVFTPEYRVPEALIGIEGYSHLWLLWQFSLAERDGWSPTVRPPRLGGNKRMGVFATRSPYRPNSIGLSSVRLIGIEHTEGEGDVLIVAGADLVDGTPIYDIKPYLAYTDSHPDAVGGYSDAVRDYKVEVSFPEELEARLPEAILATVKTLLGEDPRPAYKGDGDRVYGMIYDDYEIFFRAEGGALVVVDVKKNDK